jgi:hypothetical protein
MVVTNANSNGRWNDELTFIASFLVVSQGLVGKSQPGQVSVFSFFRFSSRIPFILCLLWMEGTPIPLFRRSRELIHDRKVAAVGVADRL